MQRNEIRWQGRGPSQRAGRTVALRCGREREEELAAVGVFARVGHREDARSVVLELEGGLLVVEGAAVDAVAAGAVTLDDVATLTAEAAHDAVEDAALHAGTRSHAHHPRTGGIP